MLGHYRHSLPGNWKLYHENLKDPYHATLLHTFLVTFGLMVAGNRSLMLTDDSGRHGVMASAKSDAKNVSADAKKEMRAFKEGMTLREPRFMDFVEEFDSPWSVTMATIWPNLIVQREMNTLGIRQIVPTGPHEFIMKWTMFGFEGDDEEMTPPSPAPGQSDGARRLSRARGQRGDEVRAGRHAARARQAAPGQARSWDRGGNLGHADFGGRHPCHVPALAAGDGHLMLDAAAMTRDRRLDALLLRHEVEKFNAAYAAALDEQRLTDWVEMFTDDAFYVVISRENVDRNMPVGLIYCENKGMIYDRAFALEKTAMFAPRYLRHLIGNLLILGEEQDGKFRARSNYVLMQVLYDRPDAKLHQVGVYHDVFRRVDGALKLAERRCIYDSLLIDNALCLPV